MSRRQQQVLATLVRFACVLSLLLVSFVHSPAVSIADDAVDLAAYALPDGTLPVLCLTGGTDDGKGQVDGKSCEFCRLASSIVLADAPTDFLSCPLSAELPFSPPSSDGFVRQVFSANSPPRGPPHGNLNA